MSDQPVVGMYNDNVARVVREWEIRTHLGKLLTIIDSLGFSERQETAIKDLIKQTTWRELWNGGTTVIYTNAAQELLNQALEVEREAQSTASDN